MDFLDKLVLPQSAHHMVLLKYLLVLTYLILIPYLSLLIGTNFLSVYYNRKAAKGNNGTAYRYSKQLIDLVTFNRSVVLGLGVVPLLSAMFCYAQLLHLSSLNTSGYLSITIVLFLIGIAFLYSYKNSFHLRDILKAASSSSETDTLLEKDIKNLSSKTNIAFEKYGLYSLIALLAASYIFFGTIKLAADSTRWESISSIFGIIFSLSSFINFLFFIVISLLVTASTILFYFFRQNAEVGETSVEVKQLAEKSSLLIGLISAAVFPAVLLLNTLLLPDNSLAGEMFILLAVIMFVSILIANLFYMMLKNSNTKYSNSLVFLVLLLLVAVIIKDQLAFDTTSRLQFEKLVTNYEDYQVKLKEEMGISVSEVSGEDIYNGRCIACHQFERKVVGPPYNDVLPKYEGNIESLADFILNPVKVDPNYPAMPNQGLKPNEAKAVAEYIMNIYNREKE